MYDAFPRHAWVDIDLAQFAQNIRILRSHTAPAKRLLVVKANAYGHGIVEIAKCAEALGLDYLGVANVSEGAFLRMNGVQAPLLVMGYVSVDELECAIVQGLDHFVWLPEQLIDAEAVSSRLGRTARVHLKVDIGMGRLGAPVHQILDVARMAAALRSVQVVGLATHFPKADIVADGDTVSQIKRFTQLVDVLQREGLRPPLVHAANSPATLRFNDAHFDMVRLGIAAYGLRPDADVPLPVGVAPVLAWKAKLGPCRTFEEGTPLSYGGEYRTSGSEVIAVAPLGYADGFRRYPKAVNSMLVAGEEAQVVGRVCMDQCLIRVPQRVAGPVGLEATLIGTSGQRQITADELAERWGTNSYDVVCGINVRVPRIYHTS